MLRQRGFVVPMPLVWAIGGALVVAALVGYGYRLGSNAKQGEWDKEKAAAAKAEVARVAEVGRALLAKDKIAEAANERAAANDAELKERRNAAKRNGLALASCPGERPSAPRGGEAAAVAGEPAGSGDRAASVAGDRSGGVRLHWRFVGLHDGAFTARNGEPLFRAATQYALAPERADTASPYTLDDALDVASENARAFSACLRSFEQAIEKIDAAAAAWAK